MNQIHQEIEEIIKQLLAGIKNQLIITSTHAFVNDNIIGVVRTRVAAELCSTLTALEKNGIEIDRELIKKIVNWLVFKQNDNGSWNETHVNYDSPSSVFTAICALALLDVKERFENICIPDEIFEKTANFLLTQEIDNGHFRKSEHYHADVLNADAMVAAFLIKYGLKNKRNNYIESGKRGLENICNQQYKNGAFPYGGNKIQYPYKYHLNIPCIHYQTVTLYYLVKISNLLRNTELNDSIALGIEWLKKNQNTNGTFNWKNSGLNFALYLTATNAFAVYLYSYIETDKSTTENIMNLLKVLKSQTNNNLLLRWEKSSFSEMIFGILNAFHGGFLGNYPISFKILRSLHRIHREIARWRISSKVTPSKIANIKTGYSSILSTVESSTNYPDIYMSTQAMEALAATLEKW